MLTKSFLRGFFTWLAPCELALFLGCSLLADVFESAWSIPRLWSVGVLFASAHIVAGELATLWFWRDSLWTRDAARNAFDRRWHFMLRDDGKLMLMWRNEK